MIEKSSPWLSGVTRSGHNDAVVPAVHAEQQVTPEEYVQMQPYLTPVKLIPPEKKRAWWKWAMDPMDQCTADTAMRRQCSSCTVSAVPNTENCKVSHV